MTDREILNRAINYVGIHYVNGVEDVYINPVLEKAIKAGAETLKEREERARGCKYCNVEANKNAMVEDHGYAVCPYCGRPLKGENHADD